ncbi:MAG: family 10 glycosylhydrolase [Cyanobacteriota bacterium]|nr:family 10 glycosylhydrolase [Cyanobacteriota bacterium]
MRGVWLTVTDSEVLTRPGQLAEALSFLADHGFTTIFPVIWRQGWTLYPSRVMAGYFGNSNRIHPDLAGRDPLAACVELADPLGLAVIPWMEYGWVASYGQQGGHILRRYPDWGLRNRQGQWVVKNGFDWLNGLLEPVQTWMIALITEVVTTYPVRGIQLDDRLPAMPVEGGYDRLTLTAFRQVSGILNPEERDPLWMRWRAEGLTRWLASLRAALTAIHPHLWLSLAPGPHPFAYQEYLQDSPTWMRAGWIDALHPQLYRRHGSAYARLLASAVLRVYPPSEWGRISPGLLIQSGAYRAKGSLLRQMMQENRRYGLGGEVLFFYEGLRQSRGELAQVLRSLDSEEF